MELEGAKRSFNFLQTAGVAIKVFISDRHRGIAKWIRESQAGCSHFFDIWQGFEELIAAKWKSFMLHVTNKHDNHPFPLYQKCAHEAEIENRRWIKIGTATSTVYNLQ